jgi:hypothetical protein
MNALMSRLRKLPLLLLLLFHSKDTLLLDLHPNAKMILGTRNIAFMHGPEHKVNGCVVGWCRSP